MTQPRPEQPTPCLLGACTQQCTTECRQAINQAWPRFTAAPVDAEAERAAHERAVLQERASAKAAQWFASRNQSNRRISLDDLTSDQLDHLHAELEYFQQLTAEQGQALSRAQAAREEQRTRAEEAEDVLTRLLAWCDCLDRAAQERHGKPGHPYAAAIRSLIPQADDPVSAPPFAAGFRLHLRHGEPLDGALLPSGRCLVVEDHIGGMCSYASSLEDLLRGYPDARIEWPTTGQEGPHT
ncbi:hypothetical protein ACFU8I_38415 [Streptomyces sp. NPDC057540]|uniref:hypothetical protein n=1 Tax=Streptomyces sp. NPDC057540 TaxID=3346160 RepID=UPI0036B0CB4A